MQQLNNRTKNTECQNQELGTPPQLQSKGKADVKRGMEKSIPEVRYLLTRSSRREKMGKVDTYQRNYQRTNGR